MKKTLLLTAMGLSLTLFAATAFAGGEGCDSKKKGAHKDMSAEAMKEHKGSHAGLFSKGDGNKGDAKLNEVQSDTKLIKL